MPENEPTFLPYTEIPIGFEPIASFSKRDATIFELYQELQGRGIPVVLAEGANGRRSIWSRKDSVIMKKFTQQN